MSIGSIVRHRFTRWIVATLIFAGIVAAAIYGRDLAAALVALVGKIGTLGAAGLLAFFTLYVAATLLVLPVSAITVAAGAVWGLAEGVAIVWVSASVGAAAAFLVGRYLARDWVTDKLATHPDFAAIDRAVAREGWKIVGLTRLSPVFPFSLQNYAYGLTRVSFRDYLWATCIGMTPGTVLFVYLGVLAGDVATVGAGDMAGHLGPWQWALRIAGLLVTAAAAIYVGRVAKTALAKKV
jgi:uncharacterized membrane protein YdjX (TVP38/TMEM64 family)